MPPESQVNFSCWSFFHDQNLPVYTISPFIINEQVYTPSDKSFPYGYPSLNMHDKFKDAIYIYPKRNLVVARVPFAVSAFPHLPNSGQSNWKHKPAAGQAKSSRLSTFTILYFSCLELKIFIEFFDVVKQYTQVF